jgi:hypothetical protein
VIGAGRGSFFAVSLFRESADNADIDVAVCADDISFRSVSLIPAERGLLVYSCNDLQRRLRYSRVRR